MIPAGGVQDTANFITVFLGGAEPDARDGEHFAGGAGSKVNQSAQCAVGEDAEGGHAEPSSLGPPPRSQRALDGKTLNVFRTLGGGGYTTTGRGLRPGYGCFSPLGSTMCRVAIPRR